MVSTTHSEPLRYLSPQGPQGAGKGMKYRTDRIVRNEHGQLVGYTDWIGGPTISRVSAVCPDGNTRWAHVSDEPDTYFSIPAYVNNGANGRVAGWIGHEDGRWHFYARSDQKPVAWKKVAPQLRIPTHVKSIQLSPAT